MCYTTGLTSMMPALVLLPAVLAGNYLSLTYLAADLRNNLAAIHII